MNIVKDARPGYVSVKSTDSFYYIYCLMLLFIGTVGAYDSYIAIKFQDILYEAELNPIARYLIYLDEGGVSLLVGLKFLGTVITILTLSLLYMFWNERQAVLITGVLALFQAIVVVSLWTL